MARYWVQSINDDGKEYMRIVQALATTPHTPMAVQIHLSSSIRMWLSPVVFEGKEKKWETVEKWTPGVIQPVMIYYERLSSPKHSLYPKMDQSPSLSISKPMSMTQLTLKVNEQQQRIDQLEAQLKAATSLVVFARK
jgi:hypothetical protein